MIRKKQVKLALAIIAIIFLAAVTILILANLNLNQSPTDSEAATTSLLCGNGVIDTSAGEQCDNATPLTCSKNGINFASTIAYDPNYKTYYDRATSLKMGYTLEMAVIPEQVYQIAQSFNYALDHHITPILRICYYNESNPSAGCGFRNPATYVSFLNQLADLTGVLGYCSDPTSAQCKSRTFYAIAGPNEPLAERWIPGAEVYNYPYNAAAINTMGKLNADYMNAVINGVTKPTVKLLTPAFNMTEPDFPAFTLAMKNNGAQFTKVAGVAGNAYDVNGTVISYWVNRLRTQTPLGALNLFLTEAGAYETAGVSKTDAMTMLAGQLKILRDDPKISTVLIFNGFGTNTQGSFQYNNYTNTEYKSIILQSCLKDPDPNCIYCKLCGVKPTCPVGQIAVGSAIEQPNPGPGITPSPTCIIYTCQTDPNYVPTRSTTIK